MACCCSSGPCAGCESLRNTITVEILSWQGANTSPLCGTYVLNRVTSGTPDVLYTYAEPGGSAVCGGSLDKIYVEVGGRACVLCGNSLNLGMYAYAEFAGSSFSCCGRAFVYKRNDFGFLQYSCLHIMSDRVLCGSGYQFTENWACSNVSWEAQEFSTLSRECSAFGCATFGDASTWKLSP